MYLFQHNVIRSVLVLSITMGIAVYSMDEKQCRQARELVRQQERQGQAQEYARQHQLALQVHAPQQPASELLRPQAQAPEQQNPESMYNSVFHVMFQEDFEPELLWPQLSNYLAILCNSKNTCQGKVIAEHASKQTIALSSDGNLCAFAQGFGQDNDNTIKIHDVRTGKQIQSLAGHTNWVGCLAFSPDRRFLFSGAVDRTICKWDVQTGQLLQKFDFKGQVRFSQFSPDCQSVGVYDTGGTDGLVWNFNTGSFTASNGNGKDRMLGSPSQGQRIFCNWEKIYLWDIATQREINSFPVDGGNVSSTVLSPHGNILAVCQYGVGQHHAGVDIWDTKKWRLIKTIKKYFITLDFNGDGSFFAASHENGVDIYEAKTGRLVQALPYGPHYPDHRFPIAFDRYGQFGTIGYDGKVRVFNSIPDNVRLALRSLSLNQLIVLMSIIEPLVMGHVVHLTPNSTAWNLVNQMPAEIKELVAPCLKSTDYCTVQ